MHWFDRVRHQQLVALERDSPGTAAWLRERGAIYLYGTIGSEAVLLPDGRVRIWYADQWPESEEYTERDASPKERIGALVLGARRHPELHELLPERPDGAPNCATCAGTGDFPPAPAILCPACEGLGWVASAI